MYQRRRGVPADVEVRWLYYSGNGMCIIKMLGETHYRLIRSHNMPNRENKNILHYHQHFKVLVDVREVSGELRTERWRNWTPTASGVKLRFKRLEHEYVHN